MGLVWQVWSEMNKFFRANAYCKFSTLDSESNEGLFLKTIAQLL